MNTMNMPGFNAESSIYSSLRQYRAARQLVANTQSSSGLIPQSTDPCIEECAPWAWSGLFGLICLLNCKSRRPGAGVDPREDICRTDPCGPGCPPDQRCLGSNQSGLITEAEWSVLQADLSDIRRRLAIIAGCACKPTAPFISCGFPGAPCCAGDSCNSGIPCINGFCQQIA
jgi:hypothetical protein